MVLQKIKFESGAGDTRIVVKNQLEIAMESIILTEYSVQIDSGPEDTITGTVYFKLDHRENSFTGIPFKVTPSFYTVN